MDSLISEINQRGIKYEDGYVDSEDEEAMPQAERDLAEDAQWKIFQKNTFTRWANEHLKQANTSVNDIQTDFCDGLRLIKLVEVLSGNKFTRVNKRPNFRTQKLENVTMVLKYLENTEGLKLVNIDSTDIVDSRLKLILGLIWTLILHYSISMPLWDGEEELHDDKGKGPTPKQRIVSWVNTKMSDFPVKNLTTDWNDGVAIGALVDACAPGLCPDWDTWNSRKPLVNATEAMNAAEQWLEVPQLITPEEMVNPQVDEKAMMTYLSQFPNAKLKDGAPLHPKINPARVKAYGPGLEQSGNTINAISRFTVETFSAGRANLEVTVLSVNGASIPCEIVKNDDRNLTYSCSYIPKSEGQYRIIIKYSDKEIPNSPYLVNVQGNAGDPNKVTVSGPGVQNDANNSVGSRTFFNAFTNNAGAGTLACEVEDSHGRRDTIKPRITRPDPNGPYLIEYTPKEEGIHKVCVYFAGLPIAHSPIEVKIHPRKSGKDGVVSAMELATALKLQNSKSNADKTQAKKSPSILIPDKPPIITSPEIKKECEYSLAYVTGRGVQKNGIRAQDVVSFNVHTEQAGEGELTVKLRRADDQMETVKINKVSEHLFECGYSPQRPGQYTMDVLYNNKHINESPFKLVVGPYKQSSIRAFGPGLYNGVVGQHNTFTVVTNNESRAINFSIRGPSEAKTAFIDNGDGSIHVDYVVFEPGEYAVHIICDEENIQESPFMANIQAINPLDTSQISVTGEGINSNSHKVCKGVPTEFTIDYKKILPDVVALAKTCNKSPVELISAECHNTFGQLVPMQITQSSEATVTCTYTPNMTGYATIDISIAGIEINKSGVRVPIASGFNLNNVKLYGTGLESALLRQPVTFTIDLRDAFSTQEETQEAIKNLSLYITNDFGNQIIPKAIDMRDGTLKVEYTAPESSTSVCISVLLENQQIGESPYQVAVNPVFAVEKINVLNLEADVFKESVSKFVVNASKIDKLGNEEVTVTIRTPENQRIAGKVDNKHDGTYEVTYSTMIEGPHKIDVAYGGVPIPSSPFPINVRSGCDPSRVKAYGPGLEPSGEHLKPNVKTEFTVDYVGAGKGNLGVIIESAGEVEIVYDQSKDGTCKVEYTPKMSGVHTIYLRFNDIEIPSSPYTVQIQGDTDINNILAYGKGLESGKVRSTVPTSFKLDATNVGDVAIRATHTPSTNNMPIPILVEPVANEPNVFECKYVPQATGPTRIDIECDGKPINGSPFNIDVRPTNEPDRVLISGDGVQRQVQASLPSTFTVDAREAGTGDLNMNLTDPVGHSLPIRVVAITTEELNQPLQYQGYVNDPKQNGDIIDGNKINTGIVACTYEPFVCGEHKIHVMFAGSELPASPFVFESVPVGQADLCQIKDVIQNRVAIGDENAITVKKAGAGKGNVLGRVTQLVNGKLVDIPVDVEDNKDGTITAYYTPTEAGELHGELRFGGQLIPNGEFTQQVVPAEELNIVPKQIEAIYHPVNFKLLMEGNKDKDIQAVVIRPSGGQDPVTLNDDDDDGHVSVNYKPKERGMHELHVTSSSDGPGSVRMPLLGSPYRFFVDNAASGEVTAYGPGLIHGETGHPASFTVVLKDAGAGGLSVAIEGPSKAEISCLDNGDGTCTVTYYPLAPGLYFIDLKFMEKHIAGSPFTAKITGEQIKRTQMNMSTMSSITFEATADDISLLTAIVTSASGKEEPCVLKMLPNDRMGISFTPKECGEHKVNVYKAGKNIPKSPFIINISREDVGNPDRVRVLWPEGVKAMANQRNQFIVDSKDAGYGTFSLSIEGPSKADIECSDNGDGTCTVNFCPTEPGTYLVNVKYADEHVPGSPFNIEVGGNAPPRMVQKIVRRRENMDTTQIGSKCAFSMRIPDMDLRSITSEVISPSGKSIHSELFPIDETQFTIRFIPEEAGIHIVNVFDRGVHVSGSPYQFSVGQPAQGGSEKVQVSGPGLRHGIVDERNEFSIYTREAGAGGLSIAIEGPSKAEIFFEDRGDGSSVVFYRVRLPGEYFCSIKFQDEHIPFSPFRIHVSDPNKAGRISAYNIPVQLNQNEFISEQNESLIGNPVAFTVHCMDSEQMLVAVVQSPLKVNKVATVHKLDGDQHVVRFVPSENGPHLISVYVIPQSDQHLGVNSPNRQEIDGSPFYILVNEFTADPTTVHATGDGLRHGLVGKRNKFYVNTANAGTGVLSVLIDGPSKVQVTCEEKEDGYEFAYVTTVPGDYKITIKYGGNFDIYGSPFYARISGAEMHDNIIVNRGEQTSMLFNTATKTLASQSYNISELNTAPMPNNVICTGLGLKCGLVGLENRNQVFVDCSKAGNSMLLAGMCGPTRPCESFEVHHNGNNRFVINYSVEENGKYWLVVKWDDHHVPGSPFIIDVQNSRSY